MVMSHSSPRKSLNSAGVWSDTLNSPDAPADAPGPTDAFTVQRRLSCCVDRSRAGCGRRRIQHGRKFRWRDVADGDVRLCPFAR